MRRVLTEEEKLNIHIVQKVKEGRGHMYQIAIMPEA